MPFNIESHFLSILEYVLSNERTSFFEQFDIDSETQLNEIIPNPSVQHIWKSAHVLCRAYENGFITIKGN